LPRDPSDDVVTQADADETLELAEQFITVVLVTPVLAAERKTKRTAGP
jgi:hypothetical protein